MVLFLFNMMDWFHTAIRIAILKQSWSISIFSSKIFLIFVGLKEIGYGRVLWTHTLLKNKNKEQSHSRTGNEKIYIITKQFILE